MKISVCSGKMCKSRFSEYILKRINSDIKKFKLEHIITEECPCLGQCKNGPNVVFDWKIENYQDPIKTSKIMFERTKQKKINNNNR